MKGRSEKFLWKVSALVLLGILTAKVSSRLSDLPQKHSKRYFVRLIFAALVLLSVSSTLAANTFVAFGPIKYLRKTGAPVTVQNTFTVLDPTTSYTLRIDNAGISSALVMLNGRQVAGPSDFNSNVVVITKPVKLLATNQLAVKLSSGPGSNLTLQILGVDNVPPVITASASPAANGAGWNNSNVTVTFSCKDTTSGVASCSAPVTIATEGANQVVTGTAVDKAGNTATTSVSINLDKTPPLLTNMSPSDGATVLTPSVTLTGVATDSLSGLASVTCNGSAASVAGGTFSCPLSLNIGRNQIGVSGTDVAGNSATAFVDLTYSLAIQPTAVHVSLDLLSRIGMDTTGLTATTLLSQAPLSQGQYSLDLQFAANQHGQIMFVDNAAGHPFIVAYVPATAIQGGTFTLTPDAVADGIIMTTPLMLGISQTDRLSILAGAKQTATYQALVNGIQNALSTEALSLLDPNVFPDLYTNAWMLVINAFNTGTAAQAATLQVGPLASPPPVTVGQDSTPYLSQAAGTEIDLVDPTMVFYGYEVTGISPDIVGAKDALWSLRLGWPPYVLNPPVFVTVDPGNGNLNIRFTKGDLVSIAGQVAVAANGLKASCIILDTVFYCPATNDTIKAFVDGGTAAGLSATWGDIVGDFASLGTVESAIEKTVDFVLDPSVWPQITMAFYSSAIDKAAAVRFLQDTKGLLKGTQKVLAIVDKVLTVYDAANTKIPFFWDLIFKPGELKFCVREQQGTLSASCQLIPPTANFTKVSPATVYVGDSVLFDASGSTDDDTPLSQLQFRWDFNGDGTFETDWSSSPTATRSFSTVGFYNVLLQVKDKDGLVGSADYRLVVDAHNAGGTATHILAFRDVLPWQTTAFETVMASHGYSPGPGDNQYEILPSSAIASTELRPGQDLVVVMNDQNQGFYNTLALGLPRIERFVQNGGVLLFEASDLGWNLGSMAAAGIASLPGGVDFSPFYDQTNYNVNPSSVLMSGLPSVLTGTYASHEYFTNIPASSVVYMQNTLNQPTLLEYTAGGWIVLTGQPLEYNVIYNPTSMGLVYPRLFDYILGRITAAPQALAAVEANQPNTTPLARPSHIQ